MAQITILVEGYARIQGDVLFASPTTVLIRDCGVTILVDPGAHPQRLCDALQAHDLTPEAIDRIFLTHHHLDHLLNIRLFPQTDIYDGTTINRDDQIAEYSGNIPDTQVQVLSTPGHTPEHWSLLVQTPDGVVAVAGDVFWWRDEEEQRTDRKRLLEHADTYAQDGTLLRMSRTTLLDRADWIIPGHGKPFQAPKCPTRNRVS